MPRNKKPLSDLLAEAVQPKGAVLQRTIGPLGLEIKTAWDGLHRITSDCPSRRLQATRQAAWRATPCQDSGPPDWLVRAPSLQATEYIW